MKFIIKGGKKLKGEITLSGAKNATTKMMIATLLTDEPCELTNAPAIGDVEITAELARALGTEIIREGHTLKLHTPEIKNIRDAS